MKFIAYFTALLLISSICSLDHQAMWYESHTSFTSGTNHFDYHKIGFINYTTTTLLNEAILPPLTVTTWEVLVKRESTSTFSTERIITYRNNSSKSRYRYLFPQLNNDGKHIGGNAKPFVMFDFVRITGTCGYTFYVKYFDSDVEANAFKAFIVSGKDIYSMNSSGTFAFDANGKGAPILDDTKIKALLMGEGTICS